MNALLIVLAMLLIFPAPASVGVIGGADGPTEIFTSNTDGSDALAVIGGADGPTAVFVNGSSRFLPALCGFLGILFANAGR